jgi:hypothetical protein
MNPNILDLFTKEVLANGPDAALPCNLDNYWLEQLQKSLDDYFSELEMDEDEEEGIKECGTPDSLSLPLLAITHLMFGKNDGENISILLSEMYEHLKMYRIELSLEDIIRRDSNMLYEPATLATVLTDREICIEQKR